MNNEWSLADAFSVVTAIALGLFIMAIGFALSASFIGVFIGIAIAACRYVLGG